MSWNACFCHIAVLRDVFEEDLNGYVWNTVVSLSVLRIEVTSLDGPLCGVGYDI